MDDNKIRDAMLDGLQQGVRDAVACAFAQFCPSHESSVPQSERSDGISRQAFREHLQRIFVKAQTATQVLIG